jgi:hypothetical protein
MDSLKNLIIMALLAGVGYAVYVSLARNNVAPPPAPGVADKWAPQAEAPVASQNRPMPGGPLALSGGANTGGGNSTAPVMPAMPPEPAGSPPAAAPPSTYAPSAPPLAQQPDAMPPSARLGPPLTQEPPSDPPPLVADPSWPPRDNSVRNLAPPPESPQATAPPPANPYRADPPPAGENNLLQSRLAAFMEEVHRNLDAGKLAEAHLALSALYGHADLPPAAAREINTLLDQLAGTVIYSRKHYLEPAYFTRPGDTLETIARQYNVPWQLLARINGLMPPGAGNRDDATKDQPLPVGMELKVVRGPFQAVINLQRHELTLMLQNRYAGRFAIGIGRDQPPAEGEFAIRDKKLDSLGEAWLGLTDRIGIHGVADPSAIGRDDCRGSICVGRRDLEDLYGILSVGSRVTVVR